MCGLVYVKSYEGKSVNSAVLGIYSEQKARGSQGFGVFDADRGILEKTPKQRKIKSYLKRHPSSEVMFHHRLPTSTANVRNACHPFSTKNFFSKEKGFSGRTYILMHNGVLLNEDELKREHEKLGIKYSSTQESGAYNDSEALLWDMALYLEGQKSKLDAAGTIAFICRVIDPDDKDGGLLLFGHNNGNPLIMDRQPKRIVLSSQGKGEDLATDMLYTITLKDNRMMEQKLEIPRYRNYPQTHTHQVTERTPDADLLNRIPNTDDCFWDEASETMLIRLPDGRYVDWEEVYGTKAYQEHLAKETFKEQMKASEADHKRFEETEEVAKNVTIHYFRKKGTSDNPHVDDTVVHTTTINPHARLAMLKAANQALIEAGKEPAHNEEIAKAEAEIKAEQTELIPSEDDDWEGDFELQRAAALADEEDRLLADEEPHSDAFNGLESLKKQKLKGRKFQRDIKYRFGYYLGFYDQNIDRAYEAVELDRNWLQSEYSLQLGNGVDNKDMMYEITVMDAVMDMLIMTEPEEDEINAIDEAVSAYNKKLDEQEAPQGYWPTGAPALPMVEKVNDDGLVEYVEQTPLSKAIDAVLDKRVKHPKNILEVKTEDEEEDTPITQKGVESLRDIQNRILRKIEAQRLKEAGAA